MPNKPRAMFGIAAGLALLSVSAVPASAQWGRDGHEERHEHHGGGGGAALPLALGLGAADVLGGALLYSAPPPAYYPPQPAYYPPSPPVYYQPPPVYYAPQQQYYTPQGYQQPGYYPR